MNKLALPSRISRRNVSPITMVKQISIHCEVALNSDVCFSFSCCCGVDTRLSCFGGVPSTSRGFSSEGKVARRPIILVLADARLPNLSLFLP